MKQKRRWNRNTLEPAPQPPQPPPASHSKTTILKLMMSGLIGYGKIQIHGDGPKLNWGVCNEEADPKEINKVVCDYQAVGVPNAEIEAVMMMEIEREWVETMQLIRELLPYARIEGVPTVELTAAGLEAERARLLIPQGGYLAMKASKKYQKGIKLDEVHEKLLAEAKGVPGQEYLVSGCEKDILWRTVQRFEMQWWTFALMEKGEIYIYIDIY
jgi:hypothetical protein